MSNKQAVAEAKRTGEREEIPIQVHAGQPNLSTDKQETRGSYTSAQALAEDEHRIELGRKDKYPLRAGQYNVPDTLTNEEKELKSQAWAGEQDIDGSRREMKSRPGSTGHWEDTAIPYSSLSQEKLTVGNNEFDIPSISHTHTFNETYYSDEFTQTHMQTHITQTVTTNTAHTTINLSGRDPSLPDYPISYTRTRTYRTRTTSTRIYIPYGRHFVPRSPDCSNSNCTTNNYSNYNYSNCYIDNNCNSNSTP